MINSMIRVIIVSVISLGVTLRAFSQNRVLLVISELDHRGMKELAPLYKKIETLSWKIPEQSAALNKVYSDMALLRDNDATVEGSQKFIISYLKEDSVDVVDVIIGVHGRPERLAFYDGSVVVKDWVASFKRKADSQLSGASLRKLGMLYNLSCFGASHIPAFLEMGFKVVIGSRKVNANAELEYPWVLQSLGVGVSVKTAFKTPNSANWLNVADGPVRWLGKKQGNFLQEADSFKIIGGQSSYRLK